jgi:hypothetical protein
MIFAATPDQSGAAWIHRLVYFPDTQTYDLIPEYGEPLLVGRESVTGGRVSSFPHCAHCGAIVQPLRFPDQTEEGGESDACGTGVTVVFITAKGHSLWWTVKKDAEAQIGVGEIVL